MESKRNKNGVNPIRKWIFLLMSFVILILLLFIVARQLLQENKSEEKAITENTTKKHFTPQSISSGSDSQYDIRLTMEKDGKFQVKSTVNIKNTSNDTWKDLVFYFIPNIFTKSSLEQLNRTLVVPGTVRFNKIAVEGTPVDYLIDKDTLSLPLEKLIGPGEEVKVDFSYEFSVPEEGLRFTKSGENYHLAQFYPMIATYRDGKWNKEEYRFRGETYHTGFSDFKVSYDIPEGYTIASTSENDDYPSQRVGTFEVNKAKEVFIAILKEPLVIKKQQGDVNIRVFGFEDKEDLYREISEVASESLYYFQEIMGPYPLTQLDIVVDGLGMEYPGIVTIGSIYDRPVPSDILKNMVVHEIAHQWFYGMINNDPYYEAWLDEGFATFSEGLFYLSKSNENIPYDSMYRMLDNIESLPVNLPLDQYANSSHIYGKSSTMLWSLFENRGGIEEAEKFLKTYYDFYQYKEVDTEEFVRFAKKYFDLEDKSEFESWLDIEK